MGHVSTFGLVVIFEGHNYVGAAREGFADGFEGGAAHDDGVTHGDSLEIFEVGGDMPGNFALVSEAAVLVDGGDYRYGHGNKSSKVTE